MQRRHRANQFQTIVIGGGQAGLATSYHLAKRGISHLILDASAQIGDAWRNRWDSLRVFTPARYAGLPGLPFQAPGDSFPTKDQMAAYLTAYANRFRLPLRNSVRVERLWKEGDRFVMTTGTERYESENVVVAMSNYQAPRTPAFARDLNPGIVQLHSHAYRNLSQLGEGGVLVVGSGNSGAEIALEAAHSHSVWISGKESGHIPWRIDTAISRFLLVRFVRFFGHHILTVNTPLGRKLRPKLLATATPLVRVKPQDLVEAQVERTQKVVGAQNGLPLLEDGRTLNVRNVIWCTGYAHGFPWIDLPIFGTDGEPIHRSGIVDGVPGMYFVGLHFLHSMTSATLIGVGRDAARIANAIASRAQAGQEPAAISIARARVA